MELGTNNRQRREATVFDLPQKLEKLDSEFRALGERAMLLEELDGFVRRPAGVPGPNPAQ